MSQLLACPHCGKSYVISERYSGASVKCQFCGERFRVPEEELIPDAVYVDEPPRQSRRSQQSNDSDPGFPTQRMGAEPNRVVAALLGIFLGVLGVHHFYTGQTSKGLHCLIWPVPTCGLALIGFTILGFIDGVRYLLMSDHEWSHRWQNYAL
jgi:TM2 domain-containing membrane protein YozV